MEGKGVCPSSYYVQSENGTSKLGNFPWVQVPSWVLLEMRMRDKMKQTDRAESRPHLAELLGFYY